jgi:hypothetical protein
MHQVRVCPHCHGTHVRRAHRKNLLERVVSLVTGIRPYRCEDCDGRFLQSRLGKDVRITPTAEHTSD